MEDAGHPKDSLRALAKILWDYNNISGPPGRADLLLVMGTDDLCVPEQAAVLERQFHYPVLVVSGGVCHDKALRGEVFGGSEAAVFARIMEEHGVDPAKIVLEEQATNTGENVTRTRALLQKKGLVVQTGQLLHTPTMQRRALATAEKQWGDVSWRVTAQPLSFEAYLENLNETDFIEGLVGDTFRILDYPSKGFQTPQPMPDDVKNALRALTEVGF